MRSLLLSVLALLLSAGLSAGQPASPENAEKPAKRLSDYATTELLDRLAAAEAPDRDRLESEIVRRWHQSGSDTVDLLLSRSVEAMQAEDYGLALDLLDAVVLLAPDFAEGWNKRATIHFLKKDYGKSIADIEQTLAREPRHFGALSGLGLILQDIGQKERALKVFETALSIHPGLENAADAIADLKKELDGEPI